MHGHASTRREEPAHIGDVHGASSHVMDQNPRHRTRIQGRAQGCSGERRCLEGYVIQGWSAVDLLEIVGGPGVRLQIGCEESRRCHEGRVIV